MSEEKTKESATTGGAQKHAYHFEEIEFNPNVNGLRVVHTDATARRLIRAMYYARDRRKPQEYSFSSGPVTLHLTLPPQMEEDKRASIDQLQVVGESEITLCVQTRRIELSGLKEKELEQCTWFDWDSSCAACRLFDGPTIRGDEYTAEELISIFNSPPQRGTWEGFHDGSDEAGVSVEKAKPAQRPAALAEIATALIMAAHGFEMLPSKYSSDNGIDGVFIPIATSKSKKTDPKHSMIVVSESKYDSRSRANPAEVMEDQLSRRNLWKSCDRMRKAEGKEAQKTGSLLLKYLKEFPERVLRLAQRVRTKGSQHGKQRGDIDSLMKLIPSAEEDPQVQEITDIFAALQLRAELLPQEEQPKFLEALRYFAGK